MELHTASKITHILYNYNYTQYVKLHTVCELTHGVHNYTVVSFTYNMKKFPSLDFFYTHAVTGVTDKYEVCQDGVFLASI